MKKTLSIILVAVLAVSSVIGVTTVAAKHNTSNDAAKQLETRPAATEKITETQKPTVAQTPTEKAIEKAAVAEKTSTTKSSDKDSYEIYDDEYNTPVMPDLIGLWGNMDNGGCSIQIVKQEGNKLDIVIESRNQNGTHIATSKITVTLDTCYDEDGISGTAGFDYYDSFGAGGRGSIIISGDHIELTINEEFNPCAAWSIGNASGSYVRV